jgi:hypothetical protein
MEQELLYIFSALIFQVVLCNGNTVKSHWRTQTSFGSPFNADINTQLQS